MSTTIEQLNRFFKEGTVSVTFAKTDQGKFAVIAEQAFPTESGQSRCKHEVLGDSFEEALESAKGMIYHCHALEAKVQRGNGLIKL